MIDAWRIAGPSPLASSGRTPAASADRLVDVPLRIDLGSPGPLDVLVVTVYSSPEVRIVYAIPDGYQLNRHGQVERIGRVDLLA